MSQFHLYASKRNIWLLVWGFLENFQEAQFYNHQIQQILSSNRCLFHNVDFYLQSHLTLACSGCCDGAKACMICPFLACMVVPSRFFHPFPPFSPLSSPSLGHGVPVSNTK